MESTYFSIFMFRNTVEPLFRGALIGLKSALSSSMKVKNTKVLAAFLAISPKEVTLDYEGFSFRGLIIVIGRSGDQFGL